MFALLKRHYFALGRFVLESQLFFGFAVEVERLSNFLKDSLCVQRKITFHKKTKSEKYFSSVYLYYFCLLCLYVYLYYEVSVFNTPCLNQSEAYRFDYRNLIQLGKSVFSTYMMSTKCRPLRTLAAVVLTKLLTTLKFYRSFFWLKDPQKNAELKTYRIQCTLIELLRCVMWWPFDFEDSIITDVVLLARSY